MIEYSQAFRQECCHKSRPPEHSFHDISLRRCLNAMCVRQINFSIRQHADGGSDVEAQQDRQIS